jgi:hypothetical protein
MKDEMELDIVGHEYKTIAIIGEDTWRGSISRNLVVTHIIRLVQSEDSSCILFDTEDDKKIDVSDFTHYNTRNFDQGEYRNLLAEITMMRTRLSERKSTYDVLVYNRMDQLSVSNPSAFNTCSCSFPTPIRMSGLIRIFVANNLNIFTPEVQKQFDLVIILSLSDSAHRYLMRSNHHYENYQAHLRSIAEFEMGKSLTGRSLTGKSSGTGMQLILTPPGYNLLTMSPYFGDEYHKYINMLTTIDHDMNRVGEVSRTLTVILPRT